MKTDTITLPAAWACALINGDYTGLDNDEAQRCENAESDLADCGWSVVDCGDACFTWHYRQYDCGADCSGGDVCDYTIAKA